MMAIAFVPAAETVRPEHEDSKTWTKSTRHGVSLLSTKECRNILKPDCSKSTDDLGMSSMNGLQGRRR